MSFLELPLNGKDLDFLQRIAQADDRRINDFLYLLLAEGLKFYFSEKCISVKKNASDYTAAEKRQEAKNKELEKSTENWETLSYESKQKLGYQLIDDYFHRHSEGPDFIDQFSEKIRSYAILKNV
tara:strand:+ start:194 stop:568 length:375 start_codon:yes stop_codon:yes gene_type:complete